MNAEQYSYLPDWDNITDDEDEIYQDHEFTNNEVVSAFVDAVLAGEFNEFTESDNEAYEADEELELEIQPGIDLDMADEHWSNNEPSSFLTEAITASVEEDPTTNPLSSFSPEEFSTLPPEQLAHMKSQGDFTPSTWIKQVATATAQDLVLSQHLNNPDSPYETSFNGLLSWFDESCQEYRTFVPEFKAEFEGQQISFREELISSTHNLVGHLGYKKTYNRLAEMFFWPNMTTDVQEYIKTCDSCQRNKESTQLPTGFLHQPDMPVMSGTHFSKDFIGPLPPSQWNGIWYDSIFVYKDHFNGWIEACPTSTNATEEDIADLYFTHIFPQTGLPESIICDRDTKFTSKFWETLMQCLKIKLDMSTAFHPQTDRSTEIANKTIIQILQNWVSTKQDNWAQHLPLVAYAINISTNDTTKMSPFYLRFSRQSKFLPDPYIKTSIPATDEFLDALLVIQYMASKAIIESHSSQETYANRRR